MIFPRNFSSNHLNFFPFFQRFCSLLLIIFWISILFYHNSNKSESFILRFWLQTRSLFELPTFSLNLSGDYEKMRLIFFDSKGIPYPKFKVFLIILILLTHLIREFESSKINIFDDKITLFEDYFPSMISQKISSLDQTFINFSHKTMSFKIFFMTFSVRDSSCFWIFVGNDFNFLLDFFNIRKLVLVGDFELFKQNLDKKFYFFQKTSWFFHYWKISFGMWFWRFEEKLGQNISNFSRKFREFFEVENLYLVGDFEV